MKILISFLAVFVVCSCNDTDRGIPNCKDLTVKERYIAQMGSGNQTGKTIADCGVYEKHDCLRIGHTLNIGHRKCQKR
jgi:hypothetical protein